MPRLYIFPHAGGSPAFYIPFAKAFSGDMKRIAVQYPGAQNGSAAVPSIQTLADTLYGILAKGPARSASPSSATAWVLWSRSRSPAGSNQRATRSVRFSSPPAPHRDG